MFRFGFILYFLSMLLLGSSIKLYNGWNLVSLSENDLSSRFAKYSTISHIWKFDSREQSWKVFLNPSSPKYQTLSQLQNSYPSFNSISQHEGCWIFNSGDEVDIEIGDSQASTDFDIYSGWNLLGVPNSDLDLSKLFQNYPNITHGWTYDNRDKSWKIFENSKKYPEFRYKRFTVLNDNQAFWIFNSGGKFTVGEATPANGNDIKVGNDYLLIAWNDLGMHCIDDNYSVFSILPPYNNLRAVLIKRGEEPEKENRDIEVTFTSTTNTESASKTDFWQYADKLFGKELQPNEGLTGVFAPSPTPQKLELSSHGLLKADGIPITPYNDNGTKSYYQLVDVVAKDNKGNIVASTKAVLPVSDEMNCKTCHQSNSNWTEAKPKSGWENSSNIVEDYKFNILKLHDERHNTNLYQSAKGGTPILCASCHKSNALGTPGKNGIPQLTTAIHKAHALVEDVNGETLNSSTNRNSCYSCHPGSDTQCLRGAMGEAGINCQDCHGNMLSVGSSHREGWIDEPNCQSCHQNGHRYHSVYSDTKKKTLREILDSRFATNIENGKYRLYKESRGHGGLSCQTCHGPQHSIYPSSRFEDNLQVKAIQGHSGTISDCRVCHKQFPRTFNKGPHGMHSTSQWWVKEHREFVEDNSAESCKSCHGSDLRGSELSETFQDRDFGFKQFKAEHKVSCYDCHNGPSGPEEDEEEEEEEEEDEE